MSAADHGAGMRAGMSREDNRQSRHAEGGPLLDCLLLVAEAHGIDTSRTSLLAGLPLHREPLSPSLFTRAAERAGLASQVVSRDIEALNTALLPVVLLLKDNRACLLTDINVDSGEAQVVYPDLGAAAVNLPLAKLEADYLGRAIYVRPRLRFGARVADVHKPTRGHWFWSVIKEHRGLYRDVLLAALMINLLALVMPLFVMNVYDRVVPNFALETLWVLAAGVVLALVADLVLKLMRVWFVDLAASRIDITVSSGLMAQVLGMRMKERPASVGSFASGLQAFESVRAFIGSSTIIAFIDLPFVLVFTLIIGLLTSWWLVLPIVVGVTLCLLYAAAVQRRMHALSLSAMEAGAERNSVLVESLAGLEALKTQGAEGRMQRLWERATVFLSRTQTKMRLLSGSVASGAIWIQHTVAVAVIIVGVYLIIDGQLTQGGLIAAYLLSSRIMAPVGQSAALMMQYHQAATALEAAELVMAKETERPADAQWIEHPRLQGRIAFSGVHFQYGEEGRAVLRDVSFTINAGEHVAILGRNGSGKTTLNKLMAGLYQPDAGRVLLDDMDINQLDPAQVRRSIGYVSQDVHLFMGSLKDNILLGNPHMDDARLLEMVQLCGLGEFVNSHPQGLMMPVGERGEWLSGGQRQSVALARALIHDPSVLLLDEPTGAMDHTTEEHFKASIGDYARGKTLLVVTHRTSLLALVERIIVIDAGKIVADGPKEQVVEALRQGRIGRAG